MAKTRLLTNAEIAAIDSALRMASEQYRKLIESDPTLAVQWGRQADMADRLADLFFSYPDVEVDVSDDDNESDDPRAREAQGLPSLHHDDTPSLDTAFHDIEMEV